MNNWAPIYIGLGSNQGDSLSILRDAAIAVIEALDACQPRFSKLYQSAPIGGVEQPPFVNGVIAMLTRLAPLQVLDATRNIEVAAGRTRASEVRWGPRLLDLDLLLYGGQRLQSDRLTVPHPRMHERAFVLKPLADVAPDILIPSKGRVAGLLRGVETQEIAPLEEMF